MLVPYSDFSTQPIDQLKSVNDSYRIGSEFCVLWQAKSKEMVKWLQRQTSKCKDASVLILPSGKQRNVIMNEPMRED